MFLRKGVYPYEYMDSWENFSKISLPDKESFYRELNKGGITDEDCTHSKSLESIWNKKSWRLSWFICSKQYIIAYRCVWKL